MGVLYLLIHLAATQGEVVLVKEYGRKRGDGGMVFNGVICLFAMIFFIVSDSDGLQFVPGIWKYGIVNAVLYGAGFYFIYIAFRCGSYFITQTVCSMNYLIPVCYGLFFLKEPAGILTYAALIVSVTAVFLMGYGQKRSEAAEENGGCVSFLWILSVLLVLFSNGFISVVAKEQQEQFGGLYGNEFMIITLLGASVFLLLMGFVLEREVLRRTLVRGGLYGMCAGLLNGVQNAAYLVMLRTIPLSVLSPVREGAHMLLSFAVARLAYKEKYGKLQYVSIALSVLSLVLMQINQTV